MTTDDATKKLLVMDDVLSCTACELHEKCTAPVALSGATPSDFAIVGEAPGAEEDEKGMPFTGPAGRLLRETLTAVELDDRKIAFLNAVSCFPHGTPERKHIEACRVNRIAQQRVTKAKYVLLLGKIAATSTTPTLDMKHSRRRPFILDGVIYMVAYHPAAALRDPKTEEEFVGDLKAFAHLLTLGDDWQEMVGDRCINCECDAVWWSQSSLGWCEVHLPPAEAAKFGAIKDAQAEDYRAAMERAAKFRRDQGMANAEEAADPAWTEKAWDTLVRYLETHDEFFVDDFWAETQLEVPREARALGPVVMRAVREGFMEKTGQFRKSTASNLSEKPVWKSRIREPEAVT